MDTNHFFSFSRIAMVMKREIIENWTQNLYAFIGLYAAFALVVVGNMWGMSMNAENAFASPDIFFVGIVRIYWGLLSLYVCWAV